MVRVCAFPGCENRMVRWTPQTFHRLPFRLDRDLLNQWLVVLQIDINTSTETLKEMDYRVCSDHFDKDDFTVPRKPGTPKKFFLKKTAIPRAVQVAAERPQACSFEEAIHLEDLELMGVPQSTPKKMGHSQSERQRSAPSAAFTLSLSSPAQATVRPRTKQSSSGSYLARPATWQLAEVTGGTSASHSNLPIVSSGDISEGDREESLQEMSISFGELELHDTDKSFVPLSNTSPSSTGTGSGSRSSSNGADGWAGRKWVVDEGKLMELFRTCHQCGAAIEDKRVITQASQIRIHWSCLNEHSGQWSSCPDQRNMGRNSLLICGAILFTGATYTDVKDWAQLLNLQIPSETQFYSIQSQYLIPVINQAYKDQQQKVIEQVIQVCASGKKAELCGDARCDSPGFSSKYSGYSFQDDSTKLIIHFELVQVTEATSSVAMEAEGFRRGVDYLLSRGVDVGVISTDRAPSIRKIMREDYGQIRHEFDPWHVNKSVMKKLVTIANKRGNEELRPWLKSISNHLYWSCSSSHGDGEECVRRWSSLLHHICGVHRWEDGGVQHTCQHDPMAAQDQRRKKWIREDSSAFHALQAIVLDKTLQRDLRQMALFKHTGSLEVFHSGLLKYAQKRLHFSYDSMRARTELAVMDHNENVNRPQATTKEGKQRYMSAYSKASHQWYARPIYQRTSQTFRQGLMESVLKVREESNLQPWPRPPPRQRRLLRNIAPVPRPDPTELVAKTVSRFKPN